MLASTNIEMCEEVRKLQKNCAYLQFFLQESGAHGVTNTCAGGHDDMVTPDLH